MKKLTTTLLAAMFAFAANAVTITLNGNGGTVEGVATKSYTLSGALTLPTPVRTDYHFVGWFEDNTLNSYDFHSGAVQAGKEYQPGTLLYGTKHTVVPGTQASDLTLYAKWVKTSVYNHFHGKKVAVYGDSVSTLVGHLASTGFNGIFSGNVFYSQAYVDDCGINEHTHWWGQIIDALDMELLQINAIGGSAVGSYVYEYTPEQKAMMNYTRLNLLDDNGTPDVIFIAAGINDYGANTTGFEPGASYLTGPLDRVTSICPSFSKAYALMIRRMKDLYPSAEVIALSTFDVGDGTEVGNDAIRRTCELFNVVNIDMRNAFDRNDGTGINYMEHGIHPGISGLSAIANCFLDSYAPITNPVAEPDAGHTWGYGLVTTPATASQAGVRTYTCRRCGATRTESVPYVETPEGSVVDITSYCTQVKEYLLPDHLEVHANTVDKSVTPREFYNGYLSPLSNLMDGNESTMFTDWIQGERYLAFKFSQPVVVTGVYLLGERNAYPNIIQLVDANGHLLGQTTDGLPWVGTSHHTTITTTERVPVTEIRIVFDFEYAGHEFDLREVNFYGYPASGERTITLDPKGGTVEGGNTIQYTASTPAFNLPIPVKAGYHFVGWFKDTTKFTPGQSDYPQGTYLSGKPFVTVNPGDFIDGTLYAKWIPQEFYDHFHGKTIAFMGDSITTLTNSFPQTHPENYVNGVAYTADECAKADIIREHTWWVQIAQAVGATDYINNAIMGSEVFDESDGRSVMMNYSRINDLTINGQAPDVLFIFAGENDYRKHPSLIDDFNPNASYVTGPLDESSQTCGSFAQGYVTMIRRLMALYPYTEILALAPYGDGADVAALRARGNQTIKDICDHYGIVSFDLMQSDMATGFPNRYTISYTSFNIHPNAAGFTAIANYVFDNWEPFCDHEHCTTNGTYVAPTCLTAGSQPAVHCNDCGKDWPAKTLPALGHLYGDWTTNTVPDCVTNGSRAHACTRTGCTAATEGHTVTESIPALGHDLTEWATTVNPTTTSVGEKERHCKRTGCTYSETQEIPMLPVLAAIRNVAAVTTVGVPPVLPTEVKGLLANGTATEQNFPVVWNTDGVSFAALGKVSVSGTVTIEGLSPMPVTASVRIAEGSSVVGDNVIGEATIDTNDPQGTPENAKKDPPGTGKEENVWQENFAAAYRANGMWMTNTITWSSAKTIASIQTYYSGAHTLPSAVDFYADAACTQSMTATPGATQSHGNFRIIDYVFENPVPTTKIVLVYHPENDNHYILVERLYAYASAGGAASPLDSDELNALAADGVAVALTNGVFAYTVDGGQAVTSATAEDNMGITILPRNASTGAAYVVTLSEDGTNTRTYTIAMPATHDHQWTKVGETPATPFEDGVRTFECSICHQQRFETIPMPARATNDWFNVQFSNYGASFSDYATDPVDGGTWTRGANDASAFTLDASSHKVVALVSTNGILRYAPSPASPSGKDVSVRLRMKFDFPNQSDAPSVSGSQVGVCVFPDGKSYCYKAWNGSSWIQLYGATPKADFVDCLSEVRYITDANHPKAVRFTFDGSVLANASGDTWLPISSAATCVTSVGYVGTATLGDFRGWYVEVESESEDPELEVPVFTAENGLAVGTKTITGLGEVNALSLSIANPVEGAWYTVYTADTLEGPFFATVVAESESDEIPSVRATSSAQPLSLSVVLNPMPDSQFAKVVVSSTNHVSGATLP